MKEIEEPSRLTPVLAETDILVVGSGPGGLASLGRVMSSASVLRQRLLELLLDAQGVGGRAPRIPAARARFAIASSDKSLTVFSALAEKVDEVFSELAEGYRVEGRGVEPVERIMGADPFEAFTRRAFRGGLGWVQGECCLLDFFADESVAEVFRLAGGRF